MSLFEEATACEVTYDLATLVKEAPQDGVFLEFGVSTGGTITVIARHTRQTVWGFDCWEGLPEDLCGYKDGESFVHDPKGSFIGKPAGTLLGNIRLVDGLFEDTLPKWLEEHPAVVISFVHIDCDLYSSTKTVLDCLKYHLDDGVVIAFDEFMGYGNSNIWPHHEYKAFTEFLEYSPFDAVCIAHTTPRVAFRLKLKGSDK
jgi:hypothetical protein